MQLGLHRGVPRGAPTIRWTRPRRWRPSVRRRRLRWGVATWGNVLDYRRRPKDVTKDSAVGRVVFNLRLDVASRRDASVATLFFARRLFDDAFRKRLREESDILRRDLSDPGRGIDLVTWLGMPSAPRR